MGMEQPTMNYPQSDGYAKEEIEKLRKRVEHLENRKPTSTTVIQESKHEHREEHDYSGRFEDIEKHCHELGKKIDDCEDDIKKNKKHIHTLEGVKPEKPKKEKEVEDHSSTIKR